MADMGALVDWPWFYIIMDPKKVDSGVKVFLDGPRLGF